MRAKRIAYLIILFTIIYFLIMFVSAAGTSDGTKEALTKIWTATKVKLSSYGDLSLKVLGFKAPAVGDKVFGFTIPSSPWYVHLWIGFFAGVLVWLVNIIARLNSRIRAKVDSRNPLTNVKKWFWTEAVAGRLWKAFLWGFGYMVLNQIPLINRVVQFLTLDMLFHSTFMRAFILAIEIGCLPQIAYSVWISNLEVKYEKAYRRMSKVVASVPLEDEKD